MRLRRLCFSALAAGVASVSLIIGMPGSAGAAVCTNGVNVSVLGDASQTNNCTTDVALPAGPGVPGLP